MRSAPLATSGRTGPDPPYHFFRSLPLIGSSEEFACAKRACLVLCALCLVGRLRRCASCGKFRLYSQDKEQGTKHAAQRLTLMRGTVMWKMVQPMSVMVERDQIGKVRYRILPPRKVMTQPFWSSFLKRLPICRINFAS